MESAVLLPTLSSASPLVLQPSWEKRPGEGRVNVLQCAPWKHGTHKHDDHCISTVLLIDLTCGSEITEFVFFNLFQLGRFKTLQCWYSNVINHPPFVTIFMGGIPTIKNSAGLWHCYTHHFNSTITCCYKKESRAARRAGTAHGARRTVQAM